jgi:hypothetical protein
MSPRTTPDMVELTFDVPERLVGRVYVAIGLALKLAQEESTEGQSTAGQAESELHDWGTQPFDSELADQAWRKFSPRAQAVFSLLMENPGVAMTADEIADNLGLANGRHAVAGTVAWPSRQCAEMGLAAPFRIDFAADSSGYWMDPETARLFLAARERAQAKQADLKQPN